MTFSIAIRCSRTGMFGAAISTSGMAVGSRCVFAEAGTGVVLTQHRTNPRLGPQGLRLLREGRSARDTLDQIVRSDPGSAWRQIAVLDRTGSSATFHGSKHEPIFAEARGYGIVSIGNILANGQVCQAVVDATVQRQNDDVGDRLVAALAAGLNAGGEVFALRSAALLIVDKESFPLVDLRVDDDPSPIDALERIWAGYKPQMHEMVNRAIDPDSCGPATNSECILSRRREPSASART